MLKTILIPAIAAVALAAPANAGNGICNQLDSEPSVGGVLEVAIGLMQSGYESDEAAKLLVSTVQGQCPEYIPLLVKFAQKYG